MPLTFGVTRACLGSRDPSELRVGHLDVDNRAQAFAGILALDAAPGCPLARPNLLGDVGG